jgi:hypothetical protein
MCAETHTQRISNPCGKHHFTDMPNQMARRRVVERSIVDISRWHTGWTRPTTNRPGLVPVRDVDMQVGIAGDFEEHHLAVVRHPTILIEPIDGCFESLDVGRPRAGEKSLLRRNVRCAIHVYTPYRANTVMTLTWPPPLQVFTTEQGLPWPRFYDADVSEVLIRRTAAEATIATVLSAAQTGASLCIPGAREVRVGHSTRPTPAADGDAPAVTVTAARAAPDDAEQREYARAGGGAPGERDSTRRATLIERLCRLLR